jgi:hypothetical protein
MVFGGFGFVFSVWVGVGAYSKGVGAFSYGVVACCVADGRGGRRAWLRRYVHSWAASWWFAFGFRWFCFVSRGVWESALARRVSARVRAAPALVGGGGSPAGGAAGRAA